MPRSAGEGSLAGAARVDVSVERLEYDYDQTVWDRLKKAIGWA
jgi:hypothetical protein